MVCGHSDCKAMNLNYQLQDRFLSSRDNRIISPLRSWLCTHAATSLEKFQFLMKHGLDELLTFTAETPQRKLVAYIDVDNKFSIEDKLSQINTLQQLQNIASYGFLKRGLDTIFTYTHCGLISIPVIFIILVDRRRNLL